MLQDDKAVARASLKALDKELLKANNFLRQCKALEESLLSIRQSSARIEGLASKDPAISGALQTELAQTKILQAFADFSANIAGLSKAIKEFEEIQLKTELFLENYRNARTYAFPNSEKTIEFLEQAFGLYSVSSALFKPEFIGLVDAEKMAKELRLEKKGSQYLKLNVSDIGKLFSFLSKQGTAKGFRLDSSELKLLCKNPLAVKAEADSAKIKRLDRLAKSLEGKY